MKGNQQRKVQQNLVLDKIAEAKKIRLTLKPYTCPKCGGAKFVPDEVGHGIHNDICYCCEGLGIIGEVQTMPTEGRKPEQAEETKTPKAPETGEEGQKRNEIAPLDPVIGLASFLFSGSDKARKEEIERFNQFKAKRAEEARREKELKAKKKEAMNVARTLQDRAYINGGKAIVPDKVLLNEASPGLKKDQENHPKRVSEKIEAYEQESSGYFKRLDHDREGG